METDKSRPFVLYVAEIIYQKINEIKIKNPNLTNIQAFEIFIASDDYNEISSGNFHDKWFKELESNDYVDKSTKKKIATVGYIILLVSYSFTNLLNMNFLPLYVWPLM